MPVMGSSLAFNWPMVHDGVIRRSEEEFSDVIWRGMSPAVCMLMLTARDLGLIWTGSCADFWSGPRLGLVGCR